MKPLTSRERKYDWRTPVIEGVTRRIKRLKRIKAKLEAAQEGYRTVVRLVATSLRSCPICGGNVYDGNRYYELDGSGLWWCEKCNR